MKRSAAYVTLLSALVLASSIEAVDAANDLTIEGIHEKEQRLATAISSYGYQKEKLIADAWCSAFVWRKTKDGLQPITHGVFQGLSCGADSTSKEVRDEIEKLRKQYQFFHWHLAFPDVFRCTDGNESPENERAGWSGGFDVILGNPPWVRQELLKPIKQLLVVFQSFASTADSSVYFLERALDATRLNGRLAMLTPNKWFRANYAERLRTVLRECAHVHLLVDFGHSRNLFPDADTFPAAVVFEPSLSAVPDDTTALFVQAHDSDRERHSMQELIGHHFVRVPHSNLRGNRWQLESEAESKLLDCLMTRGQQLGSILDRPIFRGLLSGLNEAFYVDSTLRRALTATDPSCETFSKGFSVVEMLRGGYRFGTRNGTSLFHLVRTTLGHGHRLKMRKPRRQYSQRPILPFIRT